MQGDKYVCMSIEKSVIWNWISNLFGSWKVYNEKVKIGFRNNLYKILSTTFKTILAPLCVPIASAQTHSSPFIHT